MPASYSAAVTFALAARGFFGFAGAFALVARADEAAASAAALPPLPLRPAARRGCELELFGAGVEQHDRLGQA